MNYRHHFHAGNFADLLKHALLLALLDRFQADATPLEVFDTHAGAGVYDLEGEAARRSGEAAKGVVRLMQDATAPAAFESLKAVVRDLNREGEIRLYPGSPLLAARALRRGDRYIGCELRPDDHAALEKALRPFAGARALRRDGYQALVEAAGRGPRRLTLIDPPFERGDDYARVAAAAVPAQRRKGDAVAIWVPLKDLETFDAFLGRLIGEGAGAGLVVEARLKSLDDPLRMNGCALILLGAPELLKGLEGPAQAVTNWIVETLGDPGGKARVSPLD